jgi:hypothetical protein
MAAWLTALVGCASQNPNDDLAKDFTEKQLTQVSQMLTDFAKSKSCDGFNLLERHEGSYPSDTTRRLQFWNVDFCGTKRQMIIMTLKVPQDDWEVCASDMGPCGIVDSGLIKSK